MRRFAFALLLLLCGPAGAEPALTVEELVRRHVAGAPEAELLELIRSRDPDFDVSPEMLAELRLAGLPEGVIAALVARQAEAARAAGLAAPAPDAAAAAEAEARVPLVVRLGPGTAAEPARLRLYDVAPPELVEAAGLRGGAAPVLTDLAVVLLCRTPDHVPDHWRGRTPLGRDFTFTPRHELLAFVSGAGRENDGKAPAVPPPGTRATGPARAILSLALPAEIAGQVEAGLTHDLSLGVAVELDGRFLLVVEERWDGVAVEAPLELQAEIRGTPGGPLAVRFVRDAVPAKPAPTAPDPGH